MHFLCDQAEFVLNTSALTGKDSALAGLLPVHLDEVRLVFEHATTDLSDFELAVKGGIDTDHDFLKRENLGFTPVLCIGDESVCGDIHTRTVTDAERINPTDPRNGLIQANIHIPSLVGLNPLLAFKDVGPFTLGLQNWEVGGDELVVDGQITIGRLVEQNGSLVISNILNTSVQVAGFVSFDIENGAVPIS